MVQRVLRTTPLVDGHNDLPWRIREDSTMSRDVEAYDLRRRTPGHTDLARLRAGRVGAQFWSVYVPGEIKDSGFARVQLEQIDIARRVIAKYPEALRFVTSAAGSAARSPRAGSARCWGWREATLSRIRWVRCGPTISSGHAT
jgi:membrane dipeptidase